MAPFTSCCTNVFRLWRKRFILRMEHFYNLFSVFVIFNFHLQCGSSTPLNDQPHIILVVMRDLGWDDVSFHGNPQIPTPNIDRIANHGVILQNYYVTPRCQDSATALKTGKHPIHYRTPRPGCPMCPFSYDMWNYLDIQGYVIREVGTLDCDETNIPFYPWGVVREAEYILRDHDQTYPLFLQVNFPQLRADYPEQVPKEYLDKVSRIPSEARRVYAAIVMQLDRAIGHLIRLLYDTGILHNAISFFTTITGATQGANLYTWPSNYPFKGGNGTLWEGGSRAVGFVYSNRIKMKARVSNGLIHITDWLPTFFGLAGGNPEHVVGADGYDVWNVIDMEDYSPRNQVLYGIYGEKAAIRVSDYKLIIKEPYIPFNPRPVAKGEFDRLRAPLTIWNAELECHIYNDSIGCWPEREPCLFNVRYDPCEMNNLAYYMPETVKTLMWNLNQSNETAIYRERRRRSILGDKMNPISKRLKESEMKRRQQRLSERKHN